MMKSCSSIKQDQLPSDEKFQQVYELHSCSSSEVQDENRTTSPEFSVVLQDGESETDSLKSNFCGKRSKRARKTRVFCSDMVKKFGEINEEQSPLSSISDSTTEEDLAHCLIMLSKDKWEREEDEDDDSEEDSGHVVKVKKAKGKYRCETCNKLFKSYQALGGHRASYKKIKADVAARQPRNISHRVAEEKVHECPFCDRVFASGQALGGHKRSHFMGASNVVALTKVSRNVENLDIDLNLPAAVDDDDQIHFSLQ